MQYTMLTVFDMDGIFTNNKSSWRIVHEKFGIDNSDLVNLFLDGKITDKDFFNEDIKRWKERGITKQDIVMALDDAPFTIGTRECIEFFGGIGKTAIISGGIDMLANRIAKLGIDYVYANGIEFDGEVPVKLIFKVPLQKKDVILTNLMKELSLKKNDVIAVGDTKYDLSMLKLAGTSIAFNAHDELVNHVDITIDKPDLNELIKMWKIR